MQLWEWILAVPGPSCTTLICQHSCAVIYCALTMLKLTGMQLTATIFLSFHLGTQIMAKAADESNPRIAFRSKLAICASLGQLYNGNLSWKWECSHSPEFSDGNPGFIVSQIIWLSSAIRASSFSSQMTFHEYHFCFLKFSQIWQCLAYDWYVFT